MSEQAPLLSIAQTALELHWPESRVLRWIEQGLLPASRDEARRARSVDLSVAQVAQSWLA